VDTHIHITNSIYILFSSFPLFALFFFTFLLFFWHPLKLWAWFMTIYIYIYIYIFVPWKDRDKESIEYHLIYTFSFQFQWNLTNKSTEIGFFLSVLTNNKFSLIFFQLHSCENFQYFSPFVCTVIKNVYWKSCFIV